MAPRRVYQDPATTITFEEGPDRPIVRMYDPDFPDGINLDELSACSLWQLIAGMAYSMARSKVEVIVGFDPPESGQ